MVELRVVVSNPKTGKTYQKVGQHSKVAGKKIGDKINGDAFGLEGYELEITGGSDADGFPARAALSGIERKKILAAKGVGYKAEKKGERKKKSFRGNTVSNTWAQLNLKVVKEGKEKIPKLFGKEEAPKEETQEKKEAPKKEAPKKDEKKPEKEEKKKEKKPSKKSPEKKEKEGKKE